MGERDSFTGLAVSQTARVTNVAASGSNQTLLAENHPGRIGAAVFNDADQPLYLKYGATASAASFTVKIGAGGHWEMPTPIYTGRIDGLWAGPPTGAARVTEY